MNDRHQARVLLALVRGRLDEAERLIERRPLEPVSFVDLCRACDVHPRVHALLERAGRLELVGTEAAARLARLRAKVRQDNLLLLARAEQALDRLAAAGITPIALKGLDLLHRVYDGFDERTIDDVDLLVRREQLRPALEALQQAGWRAPDEPERTHYVRSSHHLPLTAPGPLAVGFEIHWNLAQDERFRIDPAELFERALPLDVAGRSVLRLEDQDGVAHLLLHHFTHYFDRRLKWLVDLQVLSAGRSFRWAGVVQRLSSWQATAATAAARVHIDKLAPGLIPDEVSRMLPLSAWRRALSFPLRSRHPLELFRGTRDRRVQLLLAAVLLEHPARLPGWLVHRMRRDQRRGANPLDGAAADESRVDRRPSASG